MKLADIPRGSFTSWLITQMWARNPVGDLARDVSDDESWPIDGTEKREFVAYLARQHACAGAMLALDRAWSSYRRRRRAQ